jgi:hypothetical protein
MNLLPGAQRRRQPPQMNRAVGIPRGKQRPLPGVEGDTGGGRTVATVTTVVEKEQPTNTSAKTIFSLVKNNNCQKQIFLILSDENSSLFKQNQSFVRSFLSRATFRTFHWSCHAHRCLRWCRLGWRWNGLPPRAGLY